MRGQRPKTKDILGNRESIQAEGILGPDARSIHTIRQWIRRMKSVFSLYKEETWFFITLPQRVYTIYTKSK